MSGRTLIVKDCLWIIRWDGGFAQLPALIVMIQLSRPTKGSFRLAFNLENALQAPRRRLPSAEVIRCNLLDPARCSRLMGWRAGEDAGLLSKARLSTENLPAGPGEGEGDESELDEAENPLVSSVSDR